jgi:hypothetical protein
MFQTATLNPYTVNGRHALLTDRSALEFVTESMRPLHTGDFGGLWIKLIWFFFGLVLSMMVLSGLLIWTKRTALATANALKRKKKARSPRVSREPAEVSHEPVPHCPTVRPAPLLAQMALSPERLLMLIPLGFMPKYFADAALFRGDAGLGERGRRHPGRPVEPAPGRTA